MPKRSFLRDLNPAQLDAVTSTKGPLLVLAGAGTGKTRVITYRIAHLLRKGALPQEILAVTFTNKAAREMRERVTELLGSKPKGITLSTFHSLGMRILRAEAAALGLRSNFSICDTSDQIALLRTILREIRGAVKTADVRAVLAAISRSKNRFASAEKVGDDAEDDFDELVARAYRRYDEELRGLNCVDFDDLILLPVRLLKESGDVRKRYRTRFRYILVDEYQDTNGSQYRFTRALVSPERNICVVGDDDQSIYGFRGAEVDKILRFEKDFPGAKVVKLEENYRSSAAILDLANAVISANSNRHPKSLRSTLPPGPAVKWIEVADAEMEADCVLRQIGKLRAEENRRYSDFAILLRSALQARPFEEKLRLRRIPYTLVGGQSYFDRKEIRDALAYWSVVNNPSDDISFLRIINFPKRGFGSTTLRKLDEMARSRRLALVQTLEAVGSGAGEFSDRLRQEARALSAIFRQARERLKKREYEKMCRELLTDAGYFGALRDLYPDPLTLASRQGAVEDLLESVKHWQRENPHAAFDDFLGAVALTAQEDGRDEKKKLRGVTLMTLHSAKGLEFPVVFLAGIEDEFLPHRKAVEEGEHAIEEERRLFYVGITRARERLLLTSAASRTTYGRERPRLPSRFLSEIEDADLLQKETYDPEATLAPEAVRSYVEAYRKLRRAQE